MTAITPSGALIELYEIDATSLGAGIFRFHAGTNEFMGDVYWNGLAYTAFPVEASGFDISGVGQLAKPKLSISNVDQTIGSLVRQYGDLIGAKFTRIRTFAKYLDSVNFIDGNQSADPTVEFPRDIFIIERKALENKLVINFDLVSYIDIQNVKLPKRQILAASCNWVYKSSECGYYDGLGMDTANYPSCTNTACDKGLNSPNGCKAHFGKNNELNFGGFPGAGLRRK